MLITEVFTGICLGSFGHIEKMLCLIHDSQRWLLKGTTHLDCRLRKVEKRKGEAGFLIGTNVGEETRDPVSVSMLVLVP